MFFFVWFFVPETKGKPFPSSTHAPTCQLSLRILFAGVSLEHMDALFGVTETPAAASSGDADEDIVATEKSESEVKESRVERLA